MNKDGSPSKPTHFGLDFVMGAGSAAIAKVRPSECSERNAVSLITHIYTDSRCSDRKGQATATEPVCYGSLWKIRTTL
jgi:hypothetical protein